MTRNAQREGPPELNCSVLVFTLGMAGGYLGYIIYQKIKDTNVVKRIQGGENE